MTATEMIPAVGHTVGLRSGVLIIDCRVLDVKMSWGKPRFLVTPCQGQGEQWVKMSSLQQSVSQKELGL